MGRGITKEEVQWGSMQIPTLRFKRSAVPDAGYAGIIHTEMALGFSCVSTVGSNIAMGWPTV